ncbi:winged helix-turn-helix transcriptional regulator [Paenibacillus lemnae]|uniref:Helix-turn-helix transcriptional regulator n=1 Tax=Paenibacillus lemnae TaxID=1330551 RepID=A0A848MBV7_PAELE|nr:helix-turn-helix domain-containing protein [Paenibacillus lemnae]NMO97630.1 helix-turn-helix transcriptional regulator [Paenibacillus lemnae]
MTEISKVLRSDCPINYSLQVFGDSWSLLIIRDILFAGKKTFGEFLASDEGIARNILTSRLAHLTENGVIVKGPHPTDMRKDLYSLSEKGLELIPILLELSAWGARNEPKTAANYAWVRDMQMDQEALIAHIRQSVTEGNSIFGESNEDRI